MRRASVPFARQKRHKYHAQPTTVDGIRFASKAEAKRYGELKLLAKAGEIRDLRLQPRFVLMAAVVEGGAVNINEGRVVGMRIVGEYRADFDYKRLDKRAYGCAKWDYCCEDVKGMATDLYRWKKRHFEAQYGIRITEIRK